MDAGFRVPIMALVAQYALDGEARQAWGTIRRRRSQRKAVGVLDSQALGRWGWQTDNWLIMVCFTPSAPFCLLYSNRGSRPHASRAAKVTSEKAALPLDESRLPN